MGQLSNTPVSSRSVWDCACRSAAGEIFNRKLLYTQNWKAYHVRRPYTLPVVVYAKTRNVDIDPGTQKVCKAAYIF